MHINKDAECIPPWYMDAYVHARVSLSFVSSVIFQRQRATPPRCDAKSTARISGARIAREETGKENIAARNYTTGSRKYISN